MCDTMTNAAVCARTSGRTEERWERGDRLRGRRRQRERESEITSERKPTVCYVTQYSTPISAESHVSL